MRSYMQQKVQFTLGKAKPRQTVVLGKLSAFKRMSAKRTPSYNSASQHAKLQASGCASRNGSSPDQGQSDSSINCGFFARVLIGIIKGYQWGISPFLPICCRFEPTCSHYAIEALRVHGLWRGSWLTIWRLLRCQPFCKGGVDLVPPPCKKRI